jgi:hypothetical protein
MPQTITWHDAYCQVKKNTIRSKFNYNMQNKHINEKNDDMNLKSHIHKTYGMMTLMITLVTCVL